MRNRFVTFLFPALVAALLIGCGGSSSVATSGPVVPSGLTYTDPAGSGWRLVKDASSTPTRLVLNLVGPSGLKCRGVGFNLKAAGALRFVALGNGLHAVDRGVFELKNVAPDPLNPPPSPEPVLFATGVKPGNMLTLGLFQKDRRATAKAVDAPVLTIAVDLDPARASALAVGSTVALDITKARIIPEDIGSVGSMVDMMAKAQMVDIQIAVGGVTLN